MTPGLLPSSSLALGDVDSSRPLSLLIIVMQTQEHVPNSVAVFDPIISNCLCTSMDGCYLVFNTTYFVRISSHTEAQLKYLSILRYFVKFYKEYFNLRCTIHEVP